MATERYLVAPRNEAGPDAGNALNEFVQQAQQSEAKIVKSEGRTSIERLVVEMTPETAADLKQRFDKSLIIEPDALLRY